MNILDAVSKVGIKIKKVASTKGGEYAGPCPGCGGRDRFRIWPEEKEGGGSYWCRSCGKGGDNVQFLVDFCGYEYKAAFKAAGRKMSANYRAAGLKPVTQDRHVVYEPVKHIPPIETWQIRADKFVNKAHQALLKNNKVLEYLDKIRGLDLAAVKLFQLGYFSGENNKNCMFRSRESWGLNTITKKDGKKKKLWIPRGLVIPAFLEGHVSRIRIRRPKPDIQSDKDVKYYILPGSSMASLVFFSQKSPGKCFVIVESELDAMLVARQIGSLAGVVAVGSATNKPSANIYYHLKQALRVLVSLDYDQAGIKAFKWWRENFENVKQWPVPEGKDPGEAFIAGINIKDWVLAGMPPVLTLTRYEKMINVPKGLYPLQELKWFLKKYPIKIKADEDKAEIIFDVGLNNQQIKNRVNQLFFDDEEVFYYLKMYHPDSVIEGDNFDFEIEEVSDGKHKDR